MMCGDAQFDLGSASLQLSTSTAIFSKPMINIIWAIGSSRWCVRVPCMVWHGPYGAECGRTRHRPAIQLIGSSGIAMRFLDL